MVRLSSDSVRRTSALLAAVVALGFAASALAAPLQPIDNELDKYWNVELAVPTLTNPSHITKGVFEGTLSIGMVPNDSYYTPLPVGIRAGYHMIETLSVEASFAYLHPFGTPELDPNDIDAETGRPAQPFGMSDLLYFLETAGKGIVTMSAHLLRPTSPTPRMTTAKTAESPPSGPC